MALSVQLKSAIRIKNVDFKACANCIGLAEGTFRNKITKNNFTAVELSKIIELMGGKLYCEFPDGTKIVFSEEDNKENI